MSAARAVKTALWTRKLKRTMHGDAHDLERVKFYCDNQAAPTLMKNPVHHQPAKHIDVCHNFIQERIARGELTVEYIPTDEMIADIFTKALPKPQFQKHRIKLGVTRRKQQRPCITPNDNTTHVPTVGSSAALTKPNHTPTRQPSAKGKIIP